MNTRSLYNFFEKRCCMRAQWEIRELAEMMLKECKKVSPLLFENAGPTCTSQKVCREGEHSCGKWKSISGAVLMGQEK
jgi:thymidylate synthase (FAD)